MDALGNKLSVLHFVLFSVQLDQVNHTVDETLFGRCIHFTLDSLKADLPKSGAFVAQQISPLQHQEYIPERLHAHAKLHPELFKEVEIVHDLLMLVSFVSHLTQTCMDDVLDFLLNFITESLSFAHLAKLRDVSEGGFFRDLRSLALVKDA